MPKDDPHKQNLYQITRHLFRKFITDKDIDTDTAATAVRIEDFHKWLCQTRAREGLFPNLDEMGEKLGITMEDVELFHEVMDNQIGFAGLMSSWWMVLSHIKPPPEHPPVAAQVSIAVQYGPNEGDIVQFAVPIRHEAGQPPLTTGSVLTALRVNFNAMLDGIITKGGLDKIYEQNVLGHPVGEIQAEALHLKSPLRGGPGF